MKPPGELPGTPPWCAKLLVAAGLVWCALCGACAAGDQGATETRVLEVVELRDALTSGMALDQQLVAGEAHDFHVDLTPGQALRLVVEQHGVDVAVALYPPEGEPAVEVDSSTGRWGDELLCWSAREAGRYRLRVRSLAQLEGSRYSLRVEHLGPSTPADRACEQAGELAAILPRTISDERGLASLQHQVDRLRRLWRQAGQPYQEALAQTNLCRTLRRSGLLEQAEPCFAIALESMRRDGPQQQVARLHNLRGLVQRDLGDLAAAETSFQVALELALASGNRMSEAAARNNLALVDKARGDHFRALARLEEVLELWRELGAREDEAISWHNLGRALMELDEVERARDCLRQAVALREFIEPATWANMLTDLGWLQQLTGQPRAALETLEQAIAVHQEAGDRAGEAGARDRLGTVLWRQGQPQRAESSYRLALSLIEGHAAEATIAVHRTNLALLELEQGRFDVAQRRLEGALEIFEASGNRDGSSHALFGLARIERERGDLRQARALLEQALSRIDFQRDAARALGRRSQAVPVWQDYDEEYIDLLLELHRVDGDAEPLARAFEVSDLSRARGLYELLVESHIDLHSGLDPELLRREDEAQARLDVTEARRLELRRQRAGDRALAQVERQLRHWEAAYQSARAAVRAHHPRFAEIRDPEPVRLTQVQAQLDADTLLLSYALGEERSWLFRLDQASIQVFQLPARAVLEELASTFHAALAGSHYRRSQQQVWEVAQQLGSVLLGPVQETLDRKRILAVTEGRLLYVPFDALRLPEPQSPRELERGRPVAAVELLLDHHEIVHLPSAGALLALRQRAARRQPAGTLLAMVADPVLKLEDTRFEHAASVGPGSQDPKSGLSALPYARREAHVILDLVPADQRLSILGFAANTERIGQPDLHDVRILHFATHAEVDDRHPDLSGLVLSQFTPDGTPRPGFLRLHGVYDLQLSADLVVLSACSTALGELLRGEGIVGLTSGFFYAGASRLVVSLWDVDDLATSVLMQRFYQGLLEDGMAPPAALRAAKQSLRRDPDLAAPYHWAAFVLQGEWQNFLPTIQPSTRSGN